MNASEAAVEYLRLTDELAAIKSKRDALKQFLKIGRNSGDETRDVQVTNSTTNVIEMAALRRYVMPDVINQCSRMRFSTKFAVVNKVKPKKPKEK